MMLPLLKMHGAGNDFVVLDAMRAALPADFDYALAAQELCARHTGIGGDGLLLLDAPDETGKALGAQARMRMWNPDSSEDMCGNGLRCVALLAWARGHVQERGFKVQTLAGARQCEIIEREEWQVRIEMGLPHFERTAIPMQPDDDNWQAMEYTLPVDGVELRGVTTLSTGSAHTVIFTPQDVESPAFEPVFQRLSPLIEHHAWFPERTSIMWANVRGPNRLRLRIWERGAGETLACGTGACAAAVAAQATGRCGHGIQVESKGGTLFIEWAPGETIQMTGPARFVFEGEWR